MRKIIAILMVVCLFSSCSRQASKVSYNISKEADNFNVIRSLSVINARTDKPVFELIGAFSFELNGNRIILTIETGKNEYKKHSVGLND